MLDELQRRNYAQNTVRAYIHAIEDFAKYFHRSPDRLGPEHIREYQVHLFRDCKLSAGTIEGRTAALRFLFVKTLRRPYLPDHIPFPKRQRRMPTVLSQEEVARLIDSAQNLMHRTMLMMLYATGLRRAELCHLKVCDIDSERMVIHVRQGKGGRDRDVLLSPKLLDTLREYWRWMKPKTYLFPGTVNNWRADVPITEKIVWTAAVQKVLNEMVFYPLSKYDGKMKIKDWSKLPHLPAPKSDGKGETKWVKPEAYYQELPLILNEVPPLPGEEALYGWIQSVWDAASKDPETRQALTDSFIAADKELIALLFSFRYNGRAIGRGWTAPKNASEWGTDYLNRTAISKSSMFQNTPEETQYQFKETDSTGQTLNGNNQYTITFPKGKLPPVKGFWSLTLYNEYHFFFPNPLNCFSLGTKNKSLQYGADGSLTLYLGIKSPGKDKETNWIPAPATPFSLLLRNYWPEQSILDGTWLPPDVEKLK